MQSPYQEKQPLAASTVLKVIPTDSPETPRTTVIVNSAVSTSANTSPRKWQPTINLIYLNNEKWKKVDKILCEEAGAFARDNNDIGCIKILQMSIILQNQIPRELTPQSKSHCLSRWAMTYKNCCWEDGKVKIQVPICSSSCVHQEERCASIIASWKRRLFLIEICCPGYRAWQTPLVAMPDLVSWIKRKTTIRASSLKVWDTLSPSLLHRVPMNGFTSHLDSQMPLQHSCGARLGCLAPSEMTCPDISPLPPGKRYGYIKSATNRHLPPF